MLIAATVLALSLFGGEPARVRATPADSGTTPGCIAPTRTGVFRLVTLNKKSNDPTTAVLMLENIQGCLEVTFITEGSGPAIIDGVSVSGDTLKGSLHMSTGKATVSLQFSDKDVTGSIVEGKRQWSIEGRRTS